VKTPEAIFRFIRIFEWRRQRRSLGSFDCKEDASRSWSRCLRSNFDGRETVFFERCLEQADDTVEEVGLRIHGTLDEEAAVETAATNRHRPTTPGELSPSS
jgi:hypothetical protein